MFMESVRRIAQSPTTHMYTRSTSRKDHIKLDPLRNIPCFPFSYANGNLNHRLNKLTTITATRFGGGNQLGRRDSKRTGPLSRRAPNSSGARHRRAVFVWAVVCLLGVPPLAQEDRTPARSSAR